MINSPIIEQFYNSMCKHEYKNIVIGLLSSYSSNRIANLRFYDWYCSIYDKKNDNIMINQYQIRGASDDFRFEIIETYSNCGLNTLISKIFDENNFNILNKNTLSINKDLLITCMLLETYKNMHVLDLQIDVILKNVISKNKILEFIKYIRIVNNTDELRNNIDYLLKDYVINL
jgi:hypothetical protein